MGLSARIIGSGTIVPSADRRSTSILVETGAESVLVDCGPGALDGLEEAGFSFRDLRKVLFTHYHPDHSLGIGHLLSAINTDPLGRREDPLIFCGPRGLRELIERWNVLYSSTVPRGDYLELVEIADGDIVSEGELEIRAAGTVHGDRPSLAYRFERGDSCVVFTGDAAYSEALVRISRGADVLLSECSFPDGASAEGHMTPSEVGRLASDAGVKRIVLLHLYPLFDGDPAADVRRRFGGRVSTARDGMEIEA